MQEKERIWLVNHLGAASDKLYCIVGNTYPIKDKLKAEGCKYNSILKWFSTSPLEVSNCTTVAIPTEEVYGWNEMTKRMEIRESAAECYNAAMEAALPHSNSTFQGQVGERLRNIPVTVTAAIRGEGAYGTTFSYTFVDENENVYMWYTTCLNDYYVNHKYNLTGTVKKHQRQMAEDRTILTRCILKEI